MFVSIVPSGKVPPVRSKSSSPRRVSVLAVAALLPASLITPLVGPAAATVTAEHDTTSPQEAARVDNVPVHELAWRPCTPDVVEPPSLMSWHMPLPDLDGVAPMSTIECSTHDVPLDYNNPNGPQLTLALTRRVASNPDERIGSLFTNPGGPGGEASTIPNVADALFAQEVLDKFDIIGVEPRGVGGSPVANCFPDSDSWVPLISNRPLVPLRSEQETIELTESVAATAAACSRPEHVMVRHSSTANVARDMDVMRRAVGDEKLSFFGASYGSVLGQTYADMFPDRVRAVAIDGVVDSPDWYGTEENSDHSLFLRVKSAQATDNALTELLKRCDKASVFLCPLSGLPGSSMESYVKLKTSLKNAPITFSDDSTGEALEIDDRLFSAMIAKMLYDSMQVELIPTAIGAFLLLAETGNTEGAEQFSAQLKKAAETVRSSDRLGAPSDSEKLHSLENPEQPEDPEAPTPEAKLRMMSAYLSVGCTDANHPDYETALKQANDHPAMLAGANWGGAMLECGHPNWTAKDTGRFDGASGARTAAPLLIVGNYWDPATNYAQAKAAAERIPNNYFLSSDNWGHVAAGKSDCANDNIAAYLVSGKKPAVDVCQVRQPFTLPFQ